MDIDDFLANELNIKGRISNLIHHLTLEEIKRMVLKYARLQRTHTRNLPESDNQESIIENNSGRFTE
jgi:hypothetical protein